MSQSSERTQNPVRRILILCTHNSARSQMAEGWIRHLAAQRGLRLEVQSAGMERTYVKPEAIQVMAEVGVDISDHRSKALSELPDPLNFDLVVTVCDQAAEACPVYPAKTHRLHVSFPDPSGQSLANWRAVRDALRRMSETLVSSLERGLIPSDQELRYATWGTTGLP